MSRVFVYYNLHKKRWSVRSQATRRVVYHCDTILLQNCEFKVSAKGRERVRREGRKNVHAGVTGKVIENFPNDKGLNGYAVKYNPYLYDGFVTIETLVNSVTHKSIGVADYVMLCANKTVIAFDEV